MYCLTKLSALCHGKSQLRLLSSVCGAFVFCSSTLVFADSLVEPADSGDMAWTDSFNMGSYTEVLEDNDLSFVSGKGAEDHVLGMDGKVAVILWDERGDDNRRGTNHDIGSRSVVNLTVIHK